MSIRVHDLTLPSFASAMLEGVKLNLQAEIEKQMTDFIMPKIKEIAKQAAEETCKQAEISICQRPFGFNDDDKFNMLINFRS